MDEQNLSDDVKKVIKSAARDAYFLNGGVERANRKFETAFHVFEKAKQYREEGYRQWRKSLRWHLAACLWWFSSLLIWLLG